MSTLTSAIKWIKKEHGGAFLRSKSVVLAFVATILHIWSSRNKVMFVGKSVTSNDIFVAIKTHVLTVLHAIYPLDCLEL